MTPSCDSSGLVVWQEMTKTVYVIIYSTWGHTKAMADKIIQGLESQGVNAKLFQVPETLSQDVLTKMHAVKMDIPVITPQDLVNADGFLLGFSTRYGMAPAQMKAFWDSTGSLWASRALDGKYCGMFNSTGSQHGGQETSILTFIPVLAHHGIIFVPVGYSSNLYSETGEVMGGGPWGSATISSSDGSRLPSQKEQEAAVSQGVYFAKTLNKVVN